MLIENEHVGIAIGIMSMRPNRNKPCLVVREGNQVTKVARFNNDEAARWFIEKVIRFMELPEPHIEGEDAENG